MDLGGIIGVAFVMDLILGDPKGAPHPVRAMGKAAKSLERMTRKRIHNPKLAGAVTVLILVSTTYAVSRGLLESLGNLSPQLPVIIETLLIYTSLATRSLFDESYPVLVKLRQGDEDQARSHLQYIVGRDTQHMNQKEITRAAVETISENTVDGVVAPLFYACIGGAPLALTYKCINRNSLCLRAKERLCLINGLSLSDTNPNDCARLLTDQGDWNFLIF